jgi:hypothetical protein
MKLTYDIGDVVEMGDGDNPQVVTVFGRLRNPSEGGNVYVVGTDDLFGLPTNGRHFRKIDENKADAERYRKRYLDKAPGWLKEESI